MAGERHGVCESAFNTAGERHGMCESAFSPFPVFIRILVVLPSEHNTLSLHIAVLLFHFAADVENVFCGCLCSSVVFDFVFFIEGASGATIG
jgi:hypothetical protein